MAQLLLLGAGSALADGSREPTMLALRGAQSTVVIDCGSNAVRQLQRLNVPLDSIERVLLTHEHQDHTSGFPLLAEMLWLAGRRRPLPVHGPANAIDIIRRVSAQWDTSDWEGFPEIQWNAVPLEMNAPVAVGADFEIIAAPGEHGHTAVIGLRARDLHGGGAIAYSADGRPSPGIRSLAQGVDILVHEATGNYPNHSTAEGAAELARAAGAKKLVLVHLAPLANDLLAQRRAAQEIFGSDVFLGEDLACYEF
jgi:ribonuclease Z